ncbi:MAG: chromosome segregation protein SMC [Ruminococcaceae bacterium]|nr:chromosome segregation protein SMC [Oscillospiraceae bacterium]
MLLTSIQVQGFKSFADKTVLKFGRGVTAVVGPNGSGKSNISDAVRWVLGEQSTKSLRGQSMEDVIFSGTADRKPHGFCEVTLNIDNADRELNFDNDFVSVTRRYYRSHESEYLINGNVVRLRDVHELFMDTGLGRDGYSMIGQGKIDSIISSKSQERRDIFEEASGISRYRYRKTDAERKLAAAEDNLLRLLDIMKELEDRIGPLSEQSKKAEKFLALAASKKELEIGLWLNILESSKNNLLNQDDKIAIAQAHYKEIESKLLGFDEQSEKNSADFARYSSEIDERRRQISEYNENVAKILGDISVLNNDILHNEESIKRLSSEIDEINSSSVSSAKEISDKREQADRKNIEIESLENLLTATENKLSELLLSSDDISRKIENDILSLNQLTTQISDTRVELVSSSATIEELTARREIANNLVSERNSEFESLNKEFAEVEELLNKIEEDITSNENTLKGYSMRFESRKASSDSAKQKLDNIRLDIEAKKRKIQILEDLEKNMDGFKHSVKAVMKQSESGQIRGVCGPLLRLLTVDKKYSVAIETALGDSAQNIVVDNEATAKYAIEMLKKTNSGRATFIPVSSTKAREFKEANLEDEFGYVGVASDLVDCHTKYSEIVKNLLGGTIVVEDIESAISISKKFKYRFKVVSLDGQVINAGGSITGGSLIKNAGLLSRGADIDKLKTDVDKLFDKEKDCLNEYNNTLAELSKCEGEIKSIQDLLKNLGEDKIRALGELRRVGELRTACEKQVTDYNAEIKMSDEKIQTLNALIQSSNLKVKELEAQKEELEEKISVLSGGRENLSADREKITSEITDIKLKIIETKKDIEGLLAAASALELNDSNRSFRIEELNSQIEEFNVKNEQIRNNIQELNTNIVSMRSACDVFEQDILSYQERRDEIEKSSVELRTNEKSLTLEREKLSGDLARLSERRDNMVKECDDVIRQLFDEYQLTKTEAEATGIKIENPAEAKKNLQEIKSKIRSLGNVNVSAIEEYKEVNERYTFMKEQIADVEKARDELHKLIGQLTEQMKELFIIGFNKIGENFSKTFTDLFGGGTAKLVLTDPDNILESGIDIVAKLPGKNVPSLDGLSGGEKALIALAIYFAIMRVNAPPFCFLDEVDTALDDINVDRFADYMSKSEFATQFICITHRRGTMEAADMLYGVTMQEKGISKLLELNVSELEKQLQA